MEPFEETLSELKREKLPQEWKEELLEKACAADFTEPDVPLFGLVSRLALGAIAACWVVIAVFLLSTPSSPDRGDLADRFGIAPEEVPLLAVRIGVAPGQNFRF